MAKHWSIRTLALLLVLISGLAPTFGRAGAQTEAAAAQNAAVETPAPSIELDTTYEAYGFVFEQHDDERHGSFDERELAALGKVIEAYAEVVGGPEMLHMMVNGPVRVRRDLQAVVSYTQAGKVIGLGRGAFDLAVTTEANFYTWGAESGQELAQIVFGHEIAHRWVDALRQETGRDWGDAYGETIWRGERPSTGTWAADADASGDGADAEEEAVTNLALHVLDKGYRWTFLHDAPSTENRQVWVDGWASDLIAFTQERQ
jgi:hypothetical protein